MLSCGWLYPLEIVHHLLLLGVCSLIPVPSVERIYIHFAEPVDTAQYKCNLKDRDEVRTLMPLIFPIKRSYLCLDTSVDFVLSFQFMIYCLPVFVNSHFIVYCIFVKPQICCNYLLHLLQTTDRVVCCCFALL